METESYFRDWLQIFRTLCNNTGTTRYQSKSEIMVYFFREKRSEILHFSVKDQDIRLNVY